MIGHNTRRTFLTNYYTNSFDWSFWNQSCPKRLESQCPENRKIVQNLFGCGPKMNPTTKAKTNGGKFLCTGMILEIFKKTSILAYHCSKF